MEEEFDKIYRETAQELFWGGLCSDKRQIFRRKCSPGGFHLFMETPGKIIRHLFHLSLSDEKRKKLRIELLPGKIHSQKTYSSNHLQLPKQHFDINEEQYADRIKQARELISELPERCRETFIKCVIEGMSYRKCASEMNVSVNTVKFHIKAAYDRLRKAVEEENILLFILLFFIIRKLNA